MKTRFRILARLKSKYGVTSFASTAEGPASNQRVFLNVVIGNHWSSSTYEIGPTYAYIANLSATSVSDSNTVMPHFLINGLRLNFWLDRGGSK